MINISWLYDEVAQFFGYLSAYFVRLASSRLADWSGDVDSLLVYVTVIFIV